MASGGLFPAVDPPTNLLTSNVWINCKVVLLFVDDFSRFCHASNDVFLVYLLQNHFTFRGCGSELICTKLANYSQIEATRKVVDDSAALFFASFGYRGGLPSGRPVGPSSADTKSVLQEQLHWLECIDERRRFGRGGDVTVCRITASEMVLK